MIKNIQIKNAQGTVTGTYPVGQIDSAFATGLTNHIEFTTKSNGENVSLIGDNNVNIEPREAVGTGEGKAAVGTANRKGGNISLKPGDDIELCSHHRGTSKNTEVAIKVMDGNDNPVKLQVFAGDITLSTKGKNKTKTKDASGNDTTTALYDDPDVMNVNVTTGDGKGYLKVRARAIDLRCEDHGGIALQPKGNDSDGHMNKIKFEHGGGDGLEFGTFNAEKTSIYTDEYRFKKNGVWKMATRTMIDSDKANASDPTTAKKYVKADDDFYDNVSAVDPVATTEQIIKAGNLWNVKEMGATNTSGNLTFAPSVYTLTPIEQTAYEEDIINPNSELQIDIRIVKRVGPNNIVKSLYPGNFNRSDFGAIVDSAQTAYTNGDSSFSAIADALSFLSTSEGGHTKYLRVLSSTSTSADNDISQYYTVTKTLAQQVSFSDIVKFVEWAKENNQGPWA